MYFLIPMLTVPPGLMLAQDHCRPAVTENKLSTCVMNLVYLASAESVSCGLCCCQSCDLIVRQNVQLSVTHYNN